MLAECSAIDNETQISGRRARPRMRRVLGCAILLAACASRSSAYQAQASKRPRAAVAPPPIDTTKGVQPSATVPYFSLGSSPLALHGDARPGVYLSAVGRRAIAMGTEDGRFELWSWPVKWLHDFQLAFRIPKYTEPIPGREVARAVTTRPEGITIEYAYEQFTVRQHVFVPLDLPAVVMLLEVDAVRPLDILVRFTPDIHFAWPAALGGQYLVWEQNARAFLFSESKRQINAFLGSPATTEASDVPAHMLAAAPPQLVLGIGAEGERYVPPRLGEPPGRGVDVHVAYVPIVLAGGQMPRDSALAIYRALIAPGAAEREWKRRVAHEDSIRTTQLSLHSPDSLLNLAVEYAKANLDDAFVCNPDLGCGLVAGYGLSGASSDRPGFGWFFGGDAAINSFAMSGIGQAGLVRDGALRFFARYQRADGKITHEISQGAGKIDWFGSYPYAFYHGDTTPFWILALYEYWRQTADTALVRELWPSLRKAFDWSRHQDSNGDGLMENPLAGAGALEVGDLQIGILSDVYLAGVWAAALDGFGRVADAMGERALADTARAIHGRAIRTMEQRLWLPASRQYAFALLQDGSVNDALTAWPATAMAFAVFNKTRGAEMAVKLASSVLMTDWGARPLASTSALFDPLHYNNGAVWPFVTGWVALAEYRYHNPLAGKLALDAIARTAFDESRGNNPEVISGRLYKPLDTAVPQQFFATSMAVTPLIRGLLGLDVDAPAGRVTFAPHLPPDWDSLRVENVPIGRSTVTIAVHRDSDRVVADVATAGSGGSPIEFTFSPALPLGARSPAELRTTPGDVHASVHGTVRESARFVVPFTGGWSTLPPAMRPAIGDRSQAPRVLSERLTGAPERYTLSLEGVAGRVYRFRVRPPDAASAVTAVASAGGDARVSSASAGRWREVDVTFPSSPANAEGYSAMTIAFTATCCRSPSPGPR